MEVTLALLFLLFLGLYAAYFGLTAGYLFSYVSETGRVWFYVHERCKKNVFWEFLTWNLPQGLRRIWYFLAAGPWLMVAQTVLAFAEQSLVWASLWSLLFVLTLPALFGVALGWVIFKVNPPSHRQKVE